VQQVTTNVSALTSVFAATLGSPVVKVAAFSYGVRRAITARKHGEVEKRVREEIKAERKGGRRGRRAGEDLGTDQKGSAA
jgi:hypothetical protein